MQEIVKVCDVHGKLTIDQTLESTSGKYKSLRCKECRRKKQVFHKRGITQEKYEHLSRDQNSRCAICRMESTSTGRSNELIPLVVDHCHKCKSHIRALLCHPCNVALGKCNDDINIIQKAIEYLKKHTE